MSNQHSMIQKNHIFIVGLGPGALKYLTLETHSILENARHIVGYSAYLERIKTQFPDATYHEFSLGEEVKRAAYALELAASNEGVVVVSSGDAGIYGMASVVLETAVQQHSSVEIHVSPGISAFQALAAEIGAGIGHDCCLISLSDLLTPKATILKRIKCAAQGDFVMALYNPASKTRKTFIYDVWNILNQYKAKDTCVVIGEKVSTPLQNIITTTLSKCDLSSINMHQIVLIGNESSRLHLLKTKPYLLTPRGYRL